MRSVPACDSGAVLPQKPGDACAATISRADFVAPVLVVWEHLPFTAAYPDLHTCHMSRHEKATSAGLGVGMDPGTLTSVASVIRAGVDLICNECGVTLAALCAAPSFDPESWC